MKNSKAHFQLFCYLITVLLLGISCTKQKGGFMVTDSGLKYKFIKSNKGIKPFNGDVMLMRITYQTDYDSVIFDSRTKSDSFTVVLVDPTFQGGVEEGFAMMSPGDSAVFQIAADSVFEKTFHGTLPPYLKPGSFLIFKVALDKIIPKSYIDSLAIANDVEFRVKEFERIDKFLIQNKMDVMPTKNGAYFLASKQGKGEYPGLGDTLFVAFTGRLLDGTIFDQSINKTPPFSVVLGKNMVIQGWEECLPLMNKGTIARMVIPSDLGFGGKNMANFLLTLH
ncbi:MAG: FKBP-type peptidyl-prolyl cis-trans isomerase [Bacteroidetes bacterium]|nr:FKBP-type peptidyl-prolyl cis-trans isomerase [Bacteroidota bacterium]